MSFENAVMELVSGQEEPSILFPYIIDLYELRIKEAAEGVGYYDKIEIKIDNSNNNKPYKKHNTTIQSPRNHTNTSCNPEDKPI